MSEKIKSTIVVKKIFFCVSNRIKLNIVKYNKKLQNVLNISSINYMIYNKIIMSEEDIIYENNTKGKIYDSYGRLIYEGELLKGKKNGIGKEYVSEGTKSKLIFEGEYLNGERRKGKEYDDYNGKLIFEGEYLNGEINI